MATPWSFVFLFFLNQVLQFTAVHSASVNETYDYIVVGSGPGGGTLASNLAKAGASVLLVEAGDDEGANPNEFIAGWFFLAYNGMYYAAPQFCISVVIRGYQIQQ
jgi:cation diffusion facilitator CzcD-associated flavoprotein CzcO